jgi:hypothetical protein
MIWTMMGVVIGIYWMQPRVVVMVVPVMVNRMPRFRRRKRMPVRVGIGGIALHCYRKGHHAVQLGLGEYGGIHIAAYGIPGECQAVAFPVQGQRAVVVDISVDVEDVVVVRGRYIAYDIVAVAAARCGEVDLVAAHQIFVVERGAQHVEGVGAAVGVHRYGVTAVAVARYRHGKPVVVVRC